MPRTQRRRPRLTGPSADTGRRDDLCALSEGVCVFLGSPAAGGKLNEAPKAASFVPPGCSLLEELR